MNSKKIVFTRFHFLALFLFILVFAGSFLFSRTYLSGKVAGNQSQGLKGELLSWKKYQNTKYGYAFQYPFTWKTQLPPPGEGTHIKGGEALLDSQYYHVVDTLNTDDTYEGILFFPFEEVIFLGREENTHVELINNIIMYVEVSTQGEFLTKKYSFHDPTGKYYMTVTMKDKPDSPKWETLAKILSTFTFDTPNKADCLSKDSYGWCETSVFQYGIDPLEFTFKLHYPESWKAAHEELPIGYLILLQKGSVRLRIFNTATHGGQCLYPGDPYVENFARKFTDFTEIEKGNGIIWRLSKAEEFNEFGYDYVVCQKGDHEQWGDSTRVGWISLHDTNHQYDDATRTEVVEILKKMELISNTP